MPENNTIPELPLIPDTAWGEFPGKETSPCGLNFDDYAKILAGVALNTQGPFTIGVFGDWGSGKTSLMQRSKCLVEDKQNVVVAWFNAWQYEHEENPIIPLIATITSALKQKEDEDTGTFKSAGKKLRTALRAIAYSATIKAGPLEFSTKDMIDREGELSDPLLERSLYYDAFRLLNDATKEKDSPRIIIFIDDLDRCLLNKALHLLEYIKLVLAQPGFIFFLGLDRRIIEAYLVKRFEKQFGVPNFSGREYLDKLVQLSFPIPSHSERIKEHIESLIEKYIHQDLRDDFTNIAKIIALASRSNPRAVVRIINSLIVDNQIDQVDDDEDKKPFGLEMLLYSRILQERKEWNDVFRILLQDNFKGEEFIKLMEERFKEKSDE